MRTICVVTGTRAEYGLLRWVMQGIRDSNDLRLQVIATGAHLSSDFGSTYQCIEKDGISIDRLVDMQLGDDSPVGVTQAMARGMSGMAAALAELRPDLMLVLGDRYEIFAAAAASMMARIPIAHVHGGESTEGAIDEAIRHAVTKMSHLHFVAAEAYRQRVIQMGENASNVFLVGGLGVDSMLRLDLMDRAELEHSLEFQFQPRNLLVTFHPATLDLESPTVQMAELLAALDKLEDTGLIFTMPNADTESRGLFVMIQDFVKTHANARAYVSLGQQRYFSCIRQVDGVVGNSSSGLAEAPSFHKGTINIGDRQKGRLKAASVIDCTPNREAINQAIRTLYSDEFRSCLAELRNPYGDGGASDRIVEVLRQHPLEGLLKKRFHRATEHRPTS